MLSRISYLPIVSETHHQRLVWLYFPILDEVFDIVLASWVPLVSKAVFSLRTTLYLGHPYIRNSKLYIIHVGVLGKRVVSLEAEQDAIGRLALWGASFIVRQEAIQFQTSQHDCPDGLCPSY